MGEVLDNVGFPSIRTNTIGGEGMAKKIKRSGKEFRLGSRKGEIGHSNPSEYFPDRIEMLVESSGRGSDIVQI